MGDMDLRLIEGFSSRHHNLVTFAAAERAGISETTWRRAHSRGILERISPGVSRIVGSPRTREQRLSAAVLGAGRGAITSHRTSAELWGVPRPASDPIDIILPVRARRAGLAGVVVHRPRDHRDLKPVLRDHIPTTNVLRMLCDLGAVDRPAVVDAVGHVLSTRLATLAALEATVVRHSEHGRHGIVALRDAVQTWSLDGKPADSTLEIAMGRIVRRFRLPPVAFHPIVNGFEVDFRIKGTNILLECDGWTTHGLDRSTFRKDRKRDRSNTIAGYITIRFTYEELVHTPAATVADIRRTLRTWAPHLLAG
jgi:very-short-patch-repair endonuclease